jgi:hypothetical protein
MKPIPKPDDPHDGNDFLNLRHYLTTTYGLSVAQCDAAVEATVNGKTRRQTERRLTAWAKALPKG